MQFSIPFKSTPPKHMHQWGLLKALTEGISFS